MRKVKRSSHKDKIVCRNTSCKHPNCPTRDVCMVCETKLDKSEVGDVQSVHTGAEEFGDER